MEERSSESITESATSQPEAEDLSTTTEKESFRVDVDRCTFGSVSAKDLYKPKSNFMIELETFVEAGDNTGYFAWITKASNKERKLCYYTCDSLMFKQRFIGEIRTTFGSGGFVCSFSERELADFHNYLERSFAFSDAGKVKKGVMCVGKQPATHVWVLNEAVQISEDGNLIQPGSSQFAWTPIGGPCIELVYGRSGSAGTIDIKSEIMTPLESHVPLYNLLASMQETLKHNFIAGVFSVASGVMAMHYETIVDTYRACPIPMLYGDIETGKSTAMRCALCICGQHNSGHLMKTKGTSDSIVMERVVKSTLPFGLDDPKGTDDVGELLIQLCNGGLSGNMKVGLRKPRSIPILCCNFNLQHIGRYRSRALMIPFQNPTIGPANDTDVEAFARLAEAQKEATRAVGWAISLGKTLVQADAANVAGPLLARVKELLPGIDPRLCVGYSLLMYFAQKLIQQAQFNVTDDELDHFLSSEVKPLFHLPDCQISTSADENRVIQTINEALQWAANKEPHQVRRSMRTGVLYQGKEVVAICLDDVASQLSSTTKQIRDSVKAKGFGSNNIPKDFVPEGSTDSVVRRPSNSHSRKCTVVWLDRVPSELQQKLQQATSSNSTSGRTQSTPVAVSTDPERVLVTTPEPQLTPIRNSDIEDSMENNDLNDILSDFINQPLSVDQNNSNVPTQIGSPQLPQSFTESLADGNFQLPIHSNISLFQMSASAASEQSSSSPPPTSSVTPPTPFISGDFQLPIHSNVTSFQTSTSAASEQSSSSSLALPSTSSVAPPTPLISGDFQMPINSNVTPFQTSPSAGSEQSSSSSLAPPTSSVAPPTPLISGNFQLPIHSNVTPFQTSTSAGSEQSSSSSLAPPTSSVAPPTPLISGDFQLPINSNVTSFQTSTSAASEQSSSSSLAPPPTSGVTPPTPLISSDLQLPIHSNITPFQTSASAGSEQSSSSSLVPPTSSVAPPTQLSSDDFQLPIHSNVTTFQISASAGSEQSSSLLLAPPPTSSVTPPTPLISGDFQLPINSNVTPFQTSPSTGSEQSSSSSLAPPPTSSVAPSKHSEPPVLHPDTEDGNKISATRSTQKIQRKRKKGSGALPHLPTKRHTRSNTRLPDWSKNIDPDKPLM